MKHMKKLFLAIIIVSAISLTVRAQNTEFTEYFSNPLVLNPAFTGSAGCSRIATSLRGDIADRSGGFGTGSISYDQYVHPIRSSLGFNYLFDMGNSVFSINTVHTANFFYSYTIQIKKDMILKPAINVGFGIKHADWDKIVIESCNPMLDVYFAPIEWPEKSTLYYFNIGTCALFSYKKLVVGVAADHLNRPMTDFWGHSKLGIKYTVHGSYQFDIGKLASITPTLIYMGDNRNKQLMVSVLSNIWYIKAGVGTQISLDRIYAMIGFQNKWMSIGYIYEYYDGFFSNSIHELTTIFKFNCRNKTDKFHILQINGF
jgi:type IX secretion system PorP/SprF family membrane protein